MGGAPRGAGHSGRRAAKPPGARERAERIWRESIARSHTPTGNANGADSRHPEQMNGDGGPSSPLLQGPAARKLRALWISAFHLGVTRDRSDEALNAWLGRHTGLDDATCDTPAGVARAVQALETWLARAAGVDWRPHISCDRGGRVREFRRPRARVLEAQWRLLHRQGQVRIASLTALGAYAARHAGLGRADSHLALTAPQADALIRHLGRRLRTASGGRG